MTWDSASQAFVDAETPQAYDPQSEARVETTGMVLDADSQAWTEVWGQKVSAYVYGAVLETVIIKKDGIIIATVETNASGVSDEKIALGYGTYTLTGSVSGWTEEQTVDKDTTTLRAMPKNSLYWYGNKIVKFTSVLIDNRSATYTVTTKEYDVNKMRFYNHGSEMRESYVTEKMSVSNYHGLKIRASGTVTTGSYGGNISIVLLENFGSYKNDYSCICRQRLCNVDISGTASFELNTYELGFANINTPAYVGLLFGNNAGSYVPNMECNMYALWIE